VNKTEAHALCFSESLTGLLPALGQQAFAAYHQGQTDN